MTTMNQRQRRPLSGIENTGVLAVEDAATEVHAFNSSPANQGGPYIDEVTLDVCNPDDAPQTLRVTMEGVSPALSFDVSIAARSVFRVFDGQPFRRNSQGTPAGIAVENVTDNVAMVAWGFFTRG